MRQAAITLGFLLLLLLAAGCDRRKEAPERDLPVSPAVTALAASATPAAPIPIPTITRDLVAPAAVVTLTPTRPPLQLPLGTPASEALQEAFAPFDLGLDQLGHVTPPSSFVMAYRYVVSSTNDITFDLALRLSFSGEPDAARADVSFTTAGNFGVEQQELRIVQLGPDSFTSRDELGCLFFPGRDELANIERFLESFPSQYLLPGLPPELVASDIRRNGYLTDHYRAAGQVYAGSSMSVASYRLDLYMDQASGHAVALRLAATGLTGRAEGGSFLERPFGFGEGDLDITLDLFQLNEPVAIELPEECQDAALSLYPLPEGASEVSSGFSFTSYLVDSDPETIAAFYQRELTALGWQEEAPAEAAGGGNVIVLAFRDAQGVSLTVRLVGGEQTSVTISAGASGE